MFETTTRKPSSVILAELLGEAPAQQVTLDWLMSRLGDRSFGMILLIVAPLGLLPGISIFIGALLIVPAYQMMLARCDIDLCIAGNLSATASVLRAGLRVVGLAEGTKVLSSVMFMIAPDGERVLAFSDCGVVIVFAATLLRIAVQERSMTAIDWALAILSPLFVLAALWRLSRTCRPGT